jgi:hypothetical protein
MEPSKQVIDLLFPAEEKVLFLGFEAAEAGERVEGIFAHGCAT